MYDTITWFSTISIFSSTLETYAHFKGAFPYVLYTCGFGSCVYLSNDRPRELFIANKREECRISSRAKKQIGVFFPGPVDLTINNSYFYSHRSNLFVIIQIKSWIFLIYIHQIFIRKKSINFKS